MQSMETEGAPRSVRKYTLPAQRQRSMWAILLAVCVLGIYPYSIRCQITPVPYNKELQWFAFGGDHVVKGKWGIHFDGGYRQMDHAAWDQWLVRPGVNYQLRKNIQLSAAYGFFNTHPGGVGWKPGAAPEHRLQQQITISRPIRKLPVRHRFRTDQRFLGSGFRDGHDRSWRLQHRARYMFRTDIPLRKAEDNRTLLSLGLYDEIFFRYDGLDGSALDQNRVFAGLTLRPTRTSAVEVGAFAQRCRPPLGGPLENNVVLLISFSSSAPLSWLFRHPQKEAAFRTAPKR